MVTSPNWMAPFHIARATVIPRERPSFPGEPAVTIAPKRKGSCRAGAWGRCRGVAVRLGAAGRGLPADEDPVDVDPRPGARADHPELERPHGGGREGLRPDDSAARGDLRVEGHRPLVDAVDVDRDLA